MISSAIYSKCAFTRMHIDDHAISLMAIYCSCNNHERIPCNEIPNTTLCPFVSSAECFDVEFESFCKCKKHKQTVQRVQYRLSRRHAGWVLLLKTNWALESSRWLFETGTGVSREVVIKRSARCPELSRLIKGPLILTTPVFTNTYLRRCPNVSSTYATDSNTANHCNSLL